MSGKKQSGSEAGSDNPEFATLDDVAQGRDTTGKTPASAVHGCRPTTCQIGDKMTKWAGIPNYECPLCGFSTVDYAAAKARRPGLDEAAA